MSTAESESVDADTDDAEEESFDYYPQVTQHPTTVIEGEIVDIVSGNSVDSDTEDTGTSFGVIYDNPTVVGDGTVWQNTNVPEGYDTVAEYNDTLLFATEGTDLDYHRGREVTEELVEAARDRLDRDPDDIDYDAEKVSGSDYKVADPTDRDGDVQEVDGTVLGISVGSDVFSSEEVGDFEEDRIMVWYGGMSGQFVGRGLDYNGLPFARWTNPDDGDPYLIKGLFQVPIGWRGDADIEEYGDVPTTDRSKLATDYGRPPRVARPPVLRDDLDGRQFIAIGRFNGGNMFEVHIGRAEDDYDDLIEQIRDDDLDEDDYDALEMKYEQDDPEGTLSDEFENPANIYALYEGEGWADTPDDATIMGGSGDSGGSFDTPDVDVDDTAVEHPTDQEVEFAEGIAEKLAGTGVSPDDNVFPTEEGSTDLEGIVAVKEDEFNVSPDVEAIREVVYENVAHLSTDDI